MHSDGCDLPIRCVLERSHCIAQGAGKRVTVVSRTFEAKRNEQIGSRSRRAAFEESHLHHPRRPWGLMKGAGTGEEPALKSRIPASDASAREDARLVALCREGDQQAWSDLVDRYSSYVYAIAVRGFRLDEHAAEDLFQEVFARTYERLGQLQDPGALRAWIAQLARRLAIDHLRSRRAQIGLEEIPEPEAAEDAIAEIDAALHVQQMLGRLPEPFREILDRFFARGESYRRIAAALDVPPGTIASRISRGLEKLRTLLEEEEY
ncbi:MAG TPA: RNA polymerase sigma factor [Solirubrobacterales bacterium]